MASVELSEQGRGRGKGLTRPTTEPLRRDGESSRRTLRHGTPPHPNLTGVAVLTRTTSVDSKTENGNSIELRRQGSNVSASKAPIQFSLSRILNPLFSACHNLVAFFFKGPKKKCYRTCHSQIAVELSSGVDGNIDCVFLRIQSAHLLELD